MANAMVGGDSAARAVVVGTLLGAAGGMGGVPPEWQETLRAGQEGQSILDALLTPWHGG